MLTPVLSALALLTRIPVRRTCSTTDLARSTPLFPVIGAFLGIAQILLMQLLAPLLPPLVVSVCLLAAAAWLTGALHLDGLADVADGLGGGVSRDEALRIMRDPAIGTFGALAVILVLMLRVSALGILIERRAAVAYLLLAPTLGRCAIVALAHGLPYARPEGGLGAAARGTTRRQLALATMITAAASIPAGATRAAVCWLAAAVTTITLGRLSARRLGGFTGDVLGAGSELAEAAALVAGVAVTR